MRRTQSDMSDVLDVLENHKNWIGVSVHDSTHVEDACKHHVAWQLQTCTPTCRDAVNKASTV